MTEAAPPQQGLIRLLSWMSPAFPTGAFSYSHALESAVAHGTVCDRDGLQDWLIVLLTSGPGWNDCVLLAQAWRQTVNGGDIHAIAELSRALAGSRERYLETCAQGDAFLVAARQWPEWTDGIGAPVAADCPLPVAVGLVSGACNIHLESTAAAYAHAYVSIQVQAALRLMRLGQQDGVKLISQLEPAILETASRAGTATLDDLGSATIVADISAMRHETLNSRIFRS